MLKQLFGHTNESNAYTIENYPYGFTQTTKIRYWIETSKSKGERFCSQTLNPKTGKWNKPKKSCYQLVCVLGLNHDNHVTYASLTNSIPQTDDKLVEFERWYTLTDFQKAQLDFVRKMIRYYSNVSFKIQVQTFEPVPPISYAPDKTL